MNTERPDHDDEPRPVSGDAPDTEGARPRTASSEAAASGSGATGTRGAGDVEASAPAEDAGAPRSEDGGDAASSEAGRVTRTGGSGAADRTEGTEPDAGASQAEAGGSAGHRPAAAPDGSTAPAARTGTAGTGEPGRTEPRAAPADASATSRLSEPEAAGPQAAGGDTPRAEEGGPARADASAAGTDGPASTGVPAADPAGPAAAGDAPAESSAPPAGDAADTHAYAGPEPVVGGSRDADRGSERPARRRTPALAASVAAAVLLVGGGGAYLAAGAAGDAGGGSTPGANGDATPPPLALDGYSESGPNGIAPGEPNPYGAAYRAEGALPDGPDAAPVFHARGQVTEDRVVALAEALGIEGRPFAEGGSWRIGGQDGSGPTLRVDKQAPGTWTFSRNIPGSDNCKGATCKAPTGAGTAAVSEAAAKKAAAPVLKAVGQDDAKLDASQVLDGSRVVNAEPEVGGLPTYGWTTGVVVGASGEVVGGSGRLAEPVKGVEYPVVSAREALDAMNGAPGAGDRVEIGGCAAPVPLDEGQQQEEPCAPAAKEPAGDTVSVDEAVFGLAAHSVDGRPALVPSWLFEVRPAGSDNPFTVTHPAVEPEFLAAPTGSGERPGEEPSGPGDEPTSAPATREVEVEGYTAQGDELTVTFTGGVCADYRATASESDGKVTVRVTETPWPDKVCILIAKQYEQTLRLDAPLGDRQVVTADGDPVPLHKGGARLPAPPSAR
ncbi:hypothetical protein SUDANB32_04623 [Streptomyces sp. enrichment culture]|uniref:hypothetical protein n=1 Tax=Streptomyces sp. enrichment culture TaxID=1795815 RepID=UPI003F55A91E